MISFSVDSGHLVSIHMTSPMNTYKGETTSWEKCISIFLVYFCNVYFLCIYYCSKSHHRWLNKRFARASFPEGAFF